jgi:hypothetical protein
MLIGTLFRVRFHGRDNQGRRKIKGKLRTKGKQTTREKTEIVTRRRQPSLTLARRSLG